MNIEFTTTANEVKLKIDQNNQFTYVLNQIIDLTGLIKDISEADSLIQLIPESSVLLQKELGSDINKLISYIVKITDAFNEAFAEVNPPS